MMCSELVYASSTLPPAKRIPIELLVLIFLECLPDHGKLEWYEWDQRFDGLGYIFIQSGLELDSIYPQGRLPRVLCPYMIPMVLSSVCKLWRQVALDTPALWTDITQDHVAKTMTLPLAQLWIERTRGRPLSLRWNNPDYGGGTADLIEEYWERWEYLEIRAEAVDYQYSGVDGSWSLGTPASLKEARLHLDYWDELEWAERNIFTGSHLQKLRLHSMEVSYYAYLRDFVSDTLTHLELDPTIPVHISLCLLHQFRNLTNANFKLRVPKDDEEEDMEEIGLLSVDGTPMKDLTIAMSSIRTFCDFFANTRFPLLTRFSLKCPMRCFGRNELHGFLSRSACKLKELELNLRGLGKEEPSSLAIVHLLNYPAIKASVEDLSIYCWRNSEGPLLSADLLDFLTVRPSHSSLPLLARLSLFGCAKNNTISAPIADMLVSRFVPLSRAQPESTSVTTTNQTCLKWADIRVGDWSQEDQAGTERLRELREAGYSFQCRPLLQNPVQNV